MGGNTNLYAYVGNSPTNLRDPSGESPCLAGAAVGVIVYNGYQVWSELDAFMAGRKVPNAGWEGAWNILSGSAQAAVAGCAIADGAANLFGEGAGELGNLREIAQPVIDEAEPFGCDVCANDLAQAFQEAGYEPNIIEAEGGAFDTFSYNGQTISTAGYHVGVEVNGYVFDNVVNGEILSTWEGSISSSGALEFNSVPFGEWGGPW